MDPAEKITENYLLVTNIYRYSYIALPTIVNKKVKVLSWSDLLPSYLFTGF